MRNRNDYEGLLLGLGVALSTYVVLIDIKYDELILHIPYLISALVNLAVYYVTFFWMKKVMTGKENSPFFIAFYMGILSRFMILLALWLIVYKLKPEYVTDLLISYVIFYFLLHGVEVALLYNRLINKKT